MFDIAFLNRCLGQSTTGKSTSLPVADVTQAVDVKRKAED